MDREQQRIKDAWIALRCQLGDAQGFAELVRELERPLLYYLARLIGDEQHALDVMQEVWLRAFRGVRKLADPSALRTWLYRMAHGLAIDRVRREVVRDRVEGASLDEDVAQPTEPDLSDADVALLHQRLGEIDFKHREVLVLHFLDDLSLAEVAAVIDCPVGTVKSRLYHAKRALQAALQRTHHDQSQ